MRRSELFGNLLRLRAEVRERGSVKASCERILEQVSSIIAGRLKRGKSGICFLSSFLSIGAIIFLFLSFDVIAQGDNINPMMLVLLDSPVYAFFDKLSTMGVMSLLDKSFPLTRGEVCELLKQAQASLKGDIERKQLERFLRLYSPPKGQNPYLWHLYRSDYTFELDLGLRGEIEPRWGSPKIERTSTLDSWGNVWGQIGDHMAFGDEVRSAMIWGRPRRLPYASVQTTELESDQTSISTINAYMIFNLRYFLLELGKDKVRWGPGVRGALTLSDNPPPMDMIKLIGSFSPFKFTFLIAPLEDEERKYLTAHRLEGKLRPWLTLAVSETGISVERLKAGYLNPFLIYFVSEESGEEDRLHNRAISFDGQIRPMDGLRIYGELMVDDFQPKRGFWDPGTKFGVLTGFQVTSPLLSNADLSCEYTFINQYAYTTTSTRTPPSKAYTHGGYVLGHWLGPDSDELWVRFRYLLNDRLSAYLIYDLERHGEGRVDKPFDPKRDKRWEFLSGVRDMQSEISIGVSYDLIGRCSAMIEGSYYWRRNVDNVRGKEESGIGVKVGGFWRF